MRNTRAEFDDYVIRALLYLIGIYLVVPAVLGVAGGFLFGIGGSVVGLLIGIIVPLFWYNWYLGNAVDKIYKREARETAEEFKVRARAIVYGDED